jgi:hypothetical protein
MPEQVKRPNPWRKMMMMMMMMMFLSCKLLKKYGKTKEKFQFANIKVHAVFKIHADALSGNPIPHSLTRKMCFSAPSCKGDNHYRILCGGCRQKIIWT